MTTSLRACPRPPKREAREKKPIRRGKRPNRKRKTSRAAMGRKADDLFSLIVRSDEICRYHGITGCRGPLQCAHIISRSYRSVRWDERNAIPLCAGAHRYFTDRPLEWGLFIDRLFGSGLFPALSKIALTKWDGDIEGVLVRLAARAVALGLTPEKP